MAKKWYDRKVQRNSKEVKKMISILKEMDIGYRFFWNRTSNLYGGYALLEETKIVVFPTDLQEFVSVACHEIAHILDHEEDRYPCYLIDDASDFTQRTFNQWCKQLLPAERHADRRGAALLKKYFPEIPFSPHYHGGQGIVHMRNHIAMVGKAEKLKIAKEYRWR